MSAPQTPQQSVPPLHEEVNQAYVLLGQRAIFVAALKEQIIILGQQLETAQAKAEENNKIVVAALAAADAYDVISAPLKTAASDDDHLTFTQLEALEWGLGALSDATIEFRDLPSAEVEE